MDAKTKAIVAHITPIGWIIAYVQNSGENKDELASFYIRQVLGIMVLGIATMFISWVPVIGWILAFVPLVLWLISLISSFSGEMKSLPVVGDMFQQWFKSI